jgi:uncharacterized membrane protein
MWIAKGIPLRSRFFLFGAIAFLWNILRPAANKATSIHTLAFLTVSNPFGGC